MSIKRWLGLDPEALVSNDKAEPYEREGAIAKLVERNDSRSWLLLLQRVERSVGAPSADMEERKLIYQAALEHRSKVLPILHKHLSNERSIAWGLKLFHALRGQDALIEEVLLCLDERAPEAFDPPESTVHLLGALVSCGDDRVARAVVPFLSSPNDDVVVQAVRTLFSTGREEYSQQLAECLLQSSSRRVQSTIAHGLEQMRWPLPMSLASGFLPQLEFIPEGPWAIEESIAASGTGAGFRSMPHFRLVRKE